MGSPYRSEPAEVRMLEPDPAPARRVRLAAATTALLGAGIGATAPMLGLGAAALGGGVAMLGLFLLREATNDAMRAPCPSCGASIGAIEPAMEAVPCPGCGEYARVNGGGLVALRDEFVAATPLFAIPIAVAVPVLPPICAECGAPSERVIGIEAPRAMASADDGLGMGGKPILLVPHCGRHADGAAASLATLRVRSYAFWLATRATNL